MTLTKKQSEWNEYLRENLSHKDYEMLDELMSETPHMTTKIKFDPTIAGLHHYIVIMSLLRKWNPKLKASFVFKEFGFAKNNTTQQERALIK